MAVFTVVNHHSKQRLLMSRSKPGLRSPASQKHVKPPREHHIKKNRKGIFVILSKHWLYVRYYSNINPVSNVWLSPFYKKRLSHGKVRWLVTCPRVPNFCMAEPGLAPTWSSPMPMFLFVPCYCLLWQSWCLYMWILSHLWWGRLFRKSLLKDWIFLMSGWRRWSVPLSPVSPIFGFCVWQITLMSYLGWLSRIFWIAVQECRQALELQRGSFKSPARNTMLSPQSPRA